MKDNPLISVIVPVYNVEPYLRKCVDSILAQTYTNLEIILVDDGSPDNCPAICDEYAAKDARVNVIHKPNGGVSSARNAGLDAATGDYIGFVDSDDWIEPDMYEVLYYAINETQAEIAICSFNCVDISGNISTNDVPSKIKSETLTRDEVMGKLISYYAWCFVVPWNKLYKTQVFDGKQYLIGKINEDGQIAHYLFYDCTSVVTVSDKLYYYLNRCDSITGSGEQYRTFDGMWGKYDQYRFFVEHGYKEYADKSWRQLYADLYTRLANMPYLPNRKEFNLAIRKIMFVKPDLRFFRILLLLAKKFIAEIVS